MSTERRLKGAIEKRGNGKYRLTVSAGFDADGEKGFEKGFLGKRRIH